MESAVVGLTGLGGRAGGVKAIGSVLGLKENVLPENN